MNNSYTCKTSCIDKGLNFCPSVDHRSGTCYSSNPVRLDVCSNDITGDTNLKYWACNYNVNCTDNYKVTMKGFGSTTNLTTLTQKTTYVLLDNICSYLLQYPTGAATGDLLNFRANRLDRAKMYYMIGYNYTDKGIVSKGWATVGTKYNATYP